MFQVGVDACVVVRTGRHSFQVFYAGGSGVLELVDYGNGFEALEAVAYWNGVEFDTSGVLGLWDLLEEVPVGGSWVYDQEQF